MATFADPGARIQRARMAKATALATTLVSYGFDADDAALMDDHDWTLAARGASVRFPSPETRALVVDEMKRRQR
jgi:hypothetical protein